ncbi:tRNA uridine-5-carboxymethylaminomethyl(34) synthesis GTPase MnmE [Candidatus Thiosymbion oneisti]|uniref:tRNA uridine-5-carboxymethylaminomethyl(34) synthesis GTPase MnmE n=1 Tax=Candidatus Thiosymbion oneisti TaxID=589554 RepID=UPI000AE9E5A3|nr:tRNA uridine-5-carboxymethylaminomethyl(34) synthesis GTPase MnmE [Candidatus Thiosymbion oneisti]
MSTAFNSYCGSTETITAIATPPGIGGVGIVRVSGPLASVVAEGLIGRVPKPRFATLADFRARDGEVIDQGIVLFFPAPRSFTGEDVLELQGHGGPVVLDLLLQRALELGARPARPGEFSERAFLNGKLDLAQAEAVADLIESTTEVAARLAGRTLQGELSRRVEGLLEGIVHLRSFVEAAIDFPDEEIDFIADSQVEADLQDLIHDARGLLTSGHQGHLIREGLDLVIAGPPNAGKSSLLNALAGVDAAIVTDIPGTTRDLLRQQIQIGGMPLHIIDTAGLRPARDPIEQEGVRRAREQIEQADHILWVFDGQSDPDHRDFDVSRLPAHVPLTYVRNKIDLTGTPAGLKQGPSGPEVAISALTGAGVDVLCEHLKAICGFPASTEGVFMARRRHLDALDRTLVCLDSALELLRQAPAVELVAEDLRQAQRALGEITGEFTPDDLLDRIFSGFCIGK